MINIITSTQAYDLQNEILNMAVKTYLNNKTKKTFVIVPNHVKFTTEIATLKKIANINKQDSVSVTNLQVLSFSRLAWYFLRNQKIALPEIIDDATSLMILEKIVKNKKDELLLFNNFNNGSLKQIYESIILIHQGNVDLNSISHEAVTEETSRKLHDLQIIYDEFIQMLGDHFTTKDGIQLILKTVLDKKLSIDNLNFFFCGFSYFSLSELNIVKIIAKKAHLSVFAFQTKDAQINDKVMEGDYDYIVQSTIAKLINFFNANSLKFFTKEYGYNINLNNKEKLNAIWTGNIPQQGLDLTNYVHLIKADSRYAEINFVAQTIYQQVVFNHYRYKDFLVLAPNLSEYETYLTPIFSQNNISMFNDLQKQMKFHPLVVMIENIADINDMGFKTQDIITILKTRLLIPEWYTDDIKFIADVDLLENFVLAHNINHQLWKKSFYDFVDNNISHLDQINEKVEKLDKLRQFIIENIDNLITQLHKLTNVQEAVTLFWNFLLKNKINKKLEKWRNTAINNGDLQLAQQPEQIWALLNKLLKDYVLIAEEFNTENFFDILISGFSEANFSQIPSVLDAVTVSEIGMVQNNSFKQVFIIGAVNNSLPKIQNKPGFLNIENINELNNSIADEQQYIENNQEVNNLDQTYQFGDVLSLASDGVYISYPIINVSNEKMEASIFYQDIKNTLNLTEYVQHDLPENQQQLLSFITTPQASLGYIVYLKNKTNDDISNLLALTPSNQALLFDNVIQASSFKNKPVNLTPALAQELYGNNINISISQLETFYANSYEYFLTYGLHLHKRFENELTNIQSGNYYHETMDRLVKYLKQHKLDFAELTKEKISVILANIQDELKTKGSYRELLGDPFNEFLFKCLDRTTKKVVNYWHQNMCQTKFYPLYSELSFGNKEYIAGLSYQFIDKQQKTHHISLRGKIDRVDLLKDCDNEILQLIDYKSSAKKFDFNLFKNGISMQMLSYLSVLQDNSHIFSTNPVNIFGAFYQTMTQKVEHLNNKANISSSFVTKRTPDESVNKLKYNGLFILDDDLNISQIDANLDTPSTYSKLYSNLRINKDNNLISANGISRNDFSLLERYNKLLIINGAKSILNGDIKLNPYKYADTTPLTFSDYNDIYFFDDMLPENNYHHILKADKKTIISEIVDEIERNKTND